MLLLLFIIIKLNAEDNMIGIKQEMFVRHNIGMKFEVCQLTEKEDSPNSV